MSPFDLFNNVLYVLLGLSAFVLLLVFAYYSLRKRNREE